MVDNVPFLVASSTEVDGGFVLDVYKSILVSTAGELYRPVRELLAVGQSNLLRSERVEDENMMMGSAERSLYLVERHRCEPSVDACGDDSEPDIPAPRVRLHCTKAIHEFVRSRAARRAGDRVA
ncbi:MAG: hypothetical protein ABIQ18_27895 [Umezawaea sp.]